MNQWQKCLQCWIPKSKKKVSLQSDDFINDMEVTSLSAIQSLPTHIRHSSVAVSFLDSSACGTPTQGDNSDFADNYIPLGECFSGSRGSIATNEATCISLPDDHFDTQNPLTLPQLIQKDIHLLDLVPPSPFSYNENFGSCCEMTEIYAPLCKKMTPLVLRGQSNLPPGSGSCGECLHRNQQLIQMYQKMDHYQNCTAEKVMASDSLFTQNHLIGSDLRYSNKCCGGKSEMVYMARNKPVSRMQRSFSSVSSASSLSDQKSCSSVGVTMQIQCPHTKTSDHFDFLHYSNVSNTLDKYNGAHSLPFSAVECEAAARKNQHMISKKMGPNELMQSSLTGSPGHCHVQDSSKILCMMPAAPTHINKFRTPKCISAKNNTSCELGEVKEDTSELIACYSGQFADLPLLLDPLVKHTGCENYYNLVPTVGLPMSTENGVIKHPVPSSCSSHSGTQKQQPFNSPDDFLQNGLHCCSADSVVLPVRKCKTAEDSTSSSDVNDSSSEFIASNSNMSHHKSLSPDFSMKPLPSSQQSQRVEYLQLDHGHCSDMVQGVFPGATHRLHQYSIIEYSEIDPCRTKALSDTKRELESNRHNNRAC